MVNKIAVIGGDMRHAMLAQLLSEDGYDVRTYAMAESESHSSAEKTINLKSIENCDALILPMPVTQNGIHINATMYKGTILLDDVMKSVSSDAIVLGGKLPLYLVKKYKQLSFYDYLEREDFAVKNSVATAEGALALAINETPHTLWNSRCLVTGFGRISKTLVRMLTALGARVDVAARKCSDRAWAHTLSCGTYEMSELEKYIEKYDLIFNTIPDKVLTSSILAKINSRSLIIDLASKPGGVDFDAAKEYGLNVIWALSLPGKVAPYTSGKILKDTIVNIFNEINE